MKPKIEIVNNNGRQVVIIHGIRFKGKRAVDWNDVKKYMTEEYSGMCYVIDSSNDSIYIDKKAIDEFTGSKYTHGLMGTVAKAKANVAQGIPELIKVARDKHFKDNQGNKHQWDARNGWYRYNSMFALPVYDGESIVRYNVYHASLLIRHDNNGRMYLYDVIDIKKETSNPLES